MVLKGVFNEKNNLHSSVSDSHNLHICVCLIKFHCWGSIQKMKKWILILCILLLPVNGYSASLSATVCTSGCDHTTLADCITSNAQDLTDNGGDTFTCNITEAFIDTALVQIRASDDSGAAWTTSATNWLKITVDAGARHDGKWDTGAYMLEASGDEIFEIREGHVILEGLQIHNTIVDGDGSCITIHDPNTPDDSTTGLKISNTILNTANLGVGIWTHSQFGGTLDVWNTVIFSPHARGGSSEGIYLRSGRDSGSDASAVITVYNSVIHNFNDGIERDAGTMVVTNSAVFNNDHDFDGVMTLDYNASNDGDGTNAVIPADWSDVFVSVTLGSEDFHLKSTDTDLRGAGTVDPGSGLYSDDIDGESRPATNWDIGADQYIEVDCTDLDGDGYGANGALNCPNGPSIDCDDGNAAINPGATETCDTIDNDCNPGTVDGSEEGWYGTPCDGNTDSDLCLEGSYECTGGTQSCNDITGDSVEVCDGIDNDCDTFIDEGFTDTDEDGLADCFDSDDDNDGIPDMSDTCPLIMPARITGASTVYYPTIWEAYSNASSNDTIQCHDILYIGDFTATRNIPVTIQGGYDCAYSIVSGVTSIEGNMTINDGKVTIENIDVQ